MTKTQNLIDRVLECERVVAGMETAPIVHDAYRLARMLKRAVEALEFVCDENGIDSYDYEKRDGAIRDLRKLIRQLSDVDFTRPIEIAEYRG